MASAKRDRLDSHPKCTVINQESSRTADGAQPRMLALSLKHAFKTRTPTHAPAMASAIAYPTCTVCNQESNGTADGAQCWRNH